MSDDHSTQSQTENTRLLTLHDHSLHGELVQTVNARDLHEGLEIKQRYGNWIAYQIKRAKLVENKDYTSYNNIVTRDTGGTVRIDHYLSLRAAQHVAMMSQSPKAEAYRDYLIACEKQLVQRATPAVKNPAHQMLIDAIIRLDAIEQRAIAAEQAAAQAKQLAAQAYQEAQMQTVAEFVFFNHLTAQVPPALHSSFGRYASAYCFDHNIPMRDIAIPGKRWRTEKAYPSTVLHHLLWPWLRTTEGQGPITGLEIGEDGVSYTE
jgi:phage anti-repressor protein